MSIETRAARYVIDLEDDGRNITDARRQRIERWLAQDPKHREAFNALRATWRYTEEVLRRVRQTKPS